jgi:hypothetical protein
MSDHRCLARTQCRASVMEDGKKMPALTECPDTLCPSCLQLVTRSVDEMPELWLALHLSIGDQTRRPNQKVSASRQPPINLNTDVDALKVAMVEWLTAAAARVAEALNVDDPHPRNNTDSEHARIVWACTRLLASNADRLVSLPADDVMVWLSSAETGYPGERLYVDEHGIEHPGVGQVEMTGAELGLKLVDLRRRARNLLALSVHDKVQLPCPYCNEISLTRQHAVYSTGYGSSEVDRVDCHLCKRDWQYSHYQQLCLIWVEEDKVEREKLQKQLNEEVKRREMSEWLLAKLEWQLGLALDCPEVSAQDFARAVLEHDKPEDLNAYMNDRDLAAIVCVSDSTVRRWASQGSITRHTAEDGSVLFWAPEVVEYAKTVTDPRAARRVNQQKANT